MMQRTSQPLPLGFMISTERGMTDLLPREHRVK